MPDSILIPMGILLDQHPGLVRRRIVQIDAGLEQFPMLSHLDLNRLRNRLPFRPQTVIALQRVCQNKPDPSIMNAGIDGLLLETVVPFFITQPQQPINFRIKLLRKRIQTQERTRDRYKGEPLCVMTCGLHGYVSNSALAIFSAVLRYQLFVQATRQSIRRTFPWHSGHR
jgi:hypothetical protein